MQKPAVGVKKPVKREPEPDFYRPSWIPKPEPAYEIPIGPLTRPVFIEPMPGVGRDVMDALMATLAALEAEPDVNGLKEKFFETMPEEDLELVLLADEITS